MVRRVRRGLAVGARRPHRGELRPKHGDWNLFTEILARNVGVSAALFLGVVTFGVMTIPLTLLTGALAGYYGGRAARSSAHGASCGTCCPTCPWSWRASRWPRRPVSCRW